MKTASKKKIWFVFEILKSHNLKLININECKKTFYNFLTSVSCL